MDNKLFVGSLPWSVTSEELGQLFGQAGQVTEATVMSDRMTGRSRGFGFVTFASADEANSAVSMFNGYDMKGRKITVSIARPKTEHDR